MVEPTGAGTNPAIKPRSIANAARGQRTQVGWLGFGVAWACASGWPAHSRARAAPGVVRHAVHDRVAAGADAVATSVSVLAADGILGSGLERGHHRCRGRPG